MRKRTRVALLATMLVVACQPAPSTSVPTAAPTAPGNASAAGPTASPLRSETATPAPVVTKLSATYSAVSPNNLPMWMAAEAGYLAQNSIDADVIFLASTTAGQGLAANSVQIGLVGAEGIDLNLEHGSAITTYVAGVTTRLVLSIMAQPGIEQVSELRGKTIAATRQGSVTDYTWRKVLQLHGLQLGQDVPITYMGTFDALVSGLTAGHVEAAVLPSPLDLQTMKQGLRVLVDTGKLDLPFLSGGILVRTDYATANPDVVERFLKAHLQAIARILNDEGAAVELLGKYLQIDDPALLRAAYATWAPTFSRDQLMPEETIIATLQESPRPNARSANPKDFYDNSYLERIKQSGFIDRLYTAR